MGLLAPPVRGSGGLTGLGSWSLRGLWWQWWDGAPGLVRKLPAAAGASLGGDDAFWSCRSLPACTCYFGVGGGGQCGPRLSGSLPAPPVGRGSREAERPGFVCQEAAPFGGGCDIAFGSGAAWTGFLARARLQERPWLGRGSSQRSLSEASSCSVRRVRMGLGGECAFRTGWAADRSGAGVSLQEGETEREHLCLSLPNSSLPVYSPTTVWWTL